MPLYYLDSSAILKLYKTETGSDVLDELFHSRQAGERLVSSYFTLVEVVSVARRLLQGRILNAAQHKALLVRFLNDVAIGIDLQSATDGIIDRAADMATRHVLRPGDALQLATALTIRNATPGERLIFIGSDHDLQDAAIAERCPTINPEDPAALGLLRHARTAPS